MDNPRREPSTKFNISRWALDHPALTRYLLVVLMVLGFAAYFQLGQDEDPPFTFRAMVVQAFWPGASAQQMADLQAVLPQVGMDYSIGGGGNYQDTCPSCRRAGVTLAQSARVGGFG